MQRLIAAALLLLNTISSSEIPIDILAAIAKTKEVAPKAEVLAKAKPAPIYKFRIHHIPTPAGYRHFDINGDDNPSHAVAYAHLMRVHAHHFAEVSKLVDLSTMNYRDVRALHSMLHSVEGGFIHKYTIGEWQTTCDVDPSKPCVHTFHFNLP